MSFTKKLCIAVMSVSMMLFMMAAAMAKPTQVYNYTTKGFVFLDTRTAVPVVTGSNYDEEINIAICKNAALVIYPFINPDPAIDKQEVEDLFVDIDQNDPIEGAHKMLRAVTQAVAANDAGVPVSSIAGDDIAGMFGLNFDNLSGGKNYGINNDFVIGTFSRNLISLEQRMENKNSNSSIKANSSTVNINPHNGKLVKLKDIFKKDADFAAVIDAELAKQQMNTTRTMLVSKLHVTGDEDFLLDTTTSEKKGGKKLVIIYKPGVIALKSDGIVRYEVPLAVLEGVLDKKKI